MKFCLLSFVSALLIVSGGLAGAEESVQTPNEPQKEAQDSQVQEQNTENSEDEFITDEERIKQKIANNNYSLSYFTQRMDLTLEQLDEAKKLSEEDKMKRESLLKSIYMLRDQSREMEQESLDNFRNLLTAEQLAVFEELREEQLKYRANYDVLEGNLKTQVEKERRIIEIDAMQRKEEEKKQEELKKFEEELKREEDNNIKHGRWQLFD